MLGEYRVLDLTDERGHLAAFILAQMGAEVIAIEPPAGSSARQLGPFADDVNDGEHSLHLSLIHISEPTRRYAIS